MKVKMEIALRKRTPGPVRHVLMDSPTQSYMLFVDVFFLQLEIGSAVQYQSATPSRICTWAIFIILIQKYIAHRAFSHFGGVFLMFYESTLHLGSIFGP
jgi:hypothetical protein